MVGTAAGRQGGTAGAWGRCEGRPAAQHVTAHAGGCVLPPGQPLRELLCQRPGEAGGHPPLSPAHAPPRCAKRGEGAPGGAGRLERRQLVPSFSRRRARCSAAAVGASWARLGEGCARAHQRQRLARAEDQQGIRAPGEAQRTLVECEAESHGWAVQARTPRCDPRGEGRGCGLKLAALPFGEPAAWKPQQVWRPPSRSQERPHRCRGTAGSCVISQRVRAWREGTGERTCCAGMRGSR